MLLTGGKMTIYEEIVELANHNCKIKEGGHTRLLEFDFCKKRIKTGKLVIMDNGIITAKKVKLMDGVVIHFADKPLIKDANFADIYKLYEDFLNSSPVGDSKRGNFRAKSSDKLTYDQMMYGEDRVKARYALEAYILLGITSGKLIWKYDNHWFHEHNGLVLYRSWFE